MSILERAKKDGAVICEKFADNDLISLHNHLKGYTLNIPSNEKIKYFVAAHLVVDRNVERQTDKTCYYSGMLVITDRFIYFSSGGYSFNPSRIRKF